MAKRGPAIKRDCAHPLARHVHGTDNAYTHDKCRCDPCTADHNRRLVEHRKRRAQRQWSGDSLWVSSPIGVRRRLEALCALGWTNTQLAREMGSTVDVLQERRKRLGNRVLRSTAQPIYELYDRLSMVRPEGAYAERARRDAAAKGWAPPLAWDDIDDPAEVPQHLVTGPAVVDEVAVAELRPTNRAERVAVIAELTGRGMSAREIGRLIGVSDALVLRYRASARVLRGLRDEQTIAALESQFEEAS